MPKSTPRRRRAPSLSLAENPADPDQHVSGTTLYYKPGANGGTFRVTATASDAQSGIASVAFPAIANVTGGGTDASSPYEMDYTWGASTAATGNQNVTAHNNAGLDERQRALHADTGFDRPHRPDARARGRPLLHDRSVSLTAGDGSDGGSGLDTSSRLYERDSATLTNGTCGAFSGSWTTVSNPDTTVASGNCYRYRYSIADNVGNRSATVTASVDAKVDTTAPAAPSLSLAENPADPDQHVSGTTLYYKPGANGGTFRVTATATDAQSGIASVAFPTIANVTGGGTDSSSPYEMDYTVGRLHRRHRQPERHRPKQRRPDERQRALHTHTGLDRSQRPDARPRGRPLLHEHVRVPDGGGRLRRGRGPRHLLAPVRARLRHAHERKLRRLLGQLDNGLQPGHDGRERQLLPLPLLDRRQRRQPLGHRHRLRRCQSRHLGAFLHRDLPGLRRHLQHGRLERGLRDQRLLRHPLRRRLRRPGRPGLHPPGRRQLLERHQLRQRHRSLEHGHARRRQLVAHLPRGELPRRRQLHRARARDRRGRRTSRRPSTRTLHDRPRRPADDDRLQPDQPDRLDERELHVQRRRGRLDASSAGSTAAPGAPAPARATTRASPTAATPSTCAPPTSPGNQDASAGLLHLARRHDGAELDDDLPGGERRVQRDRLGGRLRHRRPLRHLLRRHRLRRLPGAGLHPPGRRQLLERHELRQRHRGLEHGHDRRRQLVVRVRRRQLPRRRQLHRARARGRRGRQHRDPVEPDLHLRHDEPERALHLPRLRRQLHEHDLERGLRRPTASAARTPTPSPASRPSRSRSSASRPASTGTARSFASGDRDLPDRDARRRQLVARLPARRASPPTASTRSTCARRDDAQNTETGPSRTFRIDNTAPASTVTFPASAGTYNTAGWNAGCATNGFCGTHSDGGSGVSGRPGLHPPGRRQLLERHQLRQRHRGLEHGHARRRQLVARPSRPQASPPTAPTRCACARPTSPATSRPPSTRTFTIDRAAPQTTIDSSPSDPTASTSASFNFSLERGRLHLRVPDRRRRLGRLHQPAQLLEPRRRQPHLRRARHRRRRQHRRLPRLLHLARRHDSARPRRSTFPAASGTYNTAGWNAGCGTNGFCGTYSDGTGSGVAAGRGLHPPGRGQLLERHELRQRAPRSGTPRRSPAATGRSPSPPAASPPTALHRARARGRRRRQHRDARRAGPSRSTAPPRRRRSTPTRPTRPRSTSADFTFSSSEGSSTFECRIDGGAWGACTSPRNYTSLTDGSHTFDVRATDVAGNRTPPPPPTPGSSTRPRPPPRRPSRPPPRATRPPSGTPAARPPASAAPTRTAPARASPRSRSPSAAAPATTGTAPASPARTEVWNTATLAGGNWSFAFAAGSFPPTATTPCASARPTPSATSRRPSSRTFTIDRDAPQTTIDSNPADPTASTRADFDFSSTRAARPSSAASTAAPGAPAPARRATPSLTDGSHTFQVRATDVAGNTDGSPASYTWLVDTTAPSSTVDLPGRRRQLHRRRVGRRLRHRRPLRHLRDGAGSGVAEVEVSIRQGSGDYWDGSGFASATEVWNDATSPPATGPTTSTPPTSPPTATTPSASAPATTSATPRPPSSRTFEYRRDRALSTFAFPAAAGLYNVAGWDAGCTGRRPLRDLLRRAPPASPRSRSPSSTTAATTGTAPASPARPRSGTTPTSPPATGRTTSTAANLPADGELRRPRARAGRRGQRRGRLQPDVHLRLERARDHDRLHHGRPDQLDVGELRLLRRRARRDLRVRHRRRRLGRLHEPEGLRRPDRRRPHLRGARHRPRRQHRRQPRRLQLDDRHRRPRPRPRASRQHSGSYTAAEWDAGCTHRRPLRHLLRPPASASWTSRSPSAAAPATTGTAPASRAPPRSGTTQPSPPATGRTTSTPPTSPPTATTRCASAHATTQATPRPPSSRTFDYDATAPSSTLAFPAAAGTYNAAGWAAGCATDGLCGTYADGSSGVAEVEVSIRRGTGNYWNGTGFSSATEVWNDASLAAGDWSYGFDSSDFPADGNYTVRVRATRRRRQHGERLQPDVHLRHHGPADDHRLEPGRPDQLRRRRLRLLRRTRPAPPSSAASTAAPGAPAPAPRATPSLSDGSHTFDVRATDVAGNTDGTPASYTWLVDTTAPSSTASFPAPGGEYNAAGWDAGCATSGLCGTYGDGSGSGVAEVEVSIRRGTGNYWDGSGFSSAHRGLERRLPRRRRLVVRLRLLRLPRRRQLHGARPRNDDVGNVETPSSRTFEYDTTDPSALFAFPAAGGEYRTSGWNAGCATVGFCGPQSDSGTGVAQVEVSVQRVSDDLYWDGDSFDAGAESWFTATLAGGNWSYAFAAGNFPADGQYVVHVRATDDAGNTEAGPSRTFRIDNTDPSALVTFPAAGTRYSTAGWNAGCATSGLCGTQSDAGSGIAQVEVSLKRVSTDLYWDGDSFDAGAETYFTATLAGGNWSYAFPAAQLPGRRRLHPPRARDRRRRQHRGRPDADLHLRHDAPADDDRLQPGRPHGLHLRELRLLLERGQLHLRVPDRRRRLGRLHQPEELREPRRRQPHLPRARHRRRRQHRRHPASYTWLVDTTAPSSTIGFPAPPASTTSPAGTQAARPAAPAAPTRTAPAPVSTRSRSPSGASRPASTGTAPPSRPPPRCS